ncbi:trafficking protein particle complex subunit 10 isoform X1 [Stegostoma tigrinum]|uniref:trafficking protein particle complex subunit 10 isoform X1 n=1 Tax=Stegostoma tigrinum TaxID=3053191 RepID=UPI00286FF941|nr:trafficking protein particle complex subunit 10 isoform X1 [Stegostoma tigrinum]
MENRPLATCAGDQALFSSVYSILMQQLPREPMEWRRSYGRPPKMIHLEANFVQFKEELIPKEGNRALLTFPFLHLFWTDCCDTEVYKATAKDEITKWQNILKAYSSSDWLIVVVESDAKKKNKTNILPRTSIVDKIRNDFCNKQSDRCVVLTDPLKDSSRTQDSWNAFFTKLRTLLLMSFTKNLGKFEDDMRTMREKRTEAGWSFCEYFMVQEELAFVFEMLQQFEDALVQYDELDALFTQYVVNYGAGDGANWLTSFCQPVRSWNGLVLRKPIDMEKRELIQKNKATLLDLRSYLFSRQCTLLVFLQRPWEVAQRALELLHNCVQELKLLEVSVPVGALDCWVFLSCLEVLQRIEGCCDQAQLENNYCHTVGLWSYATEKLQSLGYLCGLISEKGPNSEELNRTVDVLAGLGAEHPETANSPQSPYKTLNEALSSVQAFEKHYLELSLTAFNMYKTIGQIRSAQLLGKDLADFYMHKGEPQKASLYLQEALKTYQTEGWTLLTAHTRKQLAECQKQLQQTQNYLQTSSLLASDSNLTDMERVHFCQEILDLAQQPVNGQGDRLVLPMDGFVQLQRLCFNPACAVVHVGGYLDIELTVNSLMPLPMHLNQFSIHLHLTVSKDPSKRSSEFGGRSRNASGVFVFPSEPSGSTLPRNSQPSVELYELYDRSLSDSTLNSSGIICKNMHLLLRRQESSSSLERPSELPLDDTAHTLRTSNILLQPGANIIHFNTQAKEAGIYTLRQLSASLGIVQFTLPHIYPIVQYEAYSQEPQLKVEPMTDSLLAGISQQVKFTIQTGHYCVKNGDALQLSITDTLPILHSASSTATVSTNTGDKVSEAPLSIQSSGKITSIFLPLAAAYHQIEFELRVICHLPSTLPTPPDSERPSTETRTIRKGLEKTKVDGPCMTSIEQKITVDCPWSIYSSLVSLTFNIPFNAKHSLLSSGRRKYLQVCVHNLSEIGFQLFDPQLEEVTKYSDLTLVSLNCLKQQHIYSKQAMFFLWELKWSQDLGASLHCQFSVAFTPLTGQEPGLIKPFTYELKLDNFCTLYDVKAEIFPPLGAEMCKTGTLCNLEVSIMRLSDLTEVDKDESLVDCDGYCTTKLMYEVVDNSSNWAVCGKSSGVISMPVAARATHKVHMEVMPLFAGFLPFPDINLFKYLPFQASQSGQMETDNWMENDTLSVDRNLDEQVESSSMRSRGSSHSSSSNEHRGIPMPRLLPFSSGQVFNTSSNMQILVIPSQDDHMLEVNVT